MTTGRVGVRGGAGTGGGPDRGAGRADRGADQLAPERPVLLGSGPGSVRPGGTLLMVTHHVDDLDDLDAHVGRTGQRDMFRSAEELAAALDPGDWEIGTAGAIGGPAPDLDGQPVTVKDTVLRAVRRR